MRLALKYDEPPVAKDLHDMMLQRMSTDRQTEWSRFSNSHNSILEKFWREEPNGKGNDTKLIWVKAKVSTHSHTPRVGGWFGGGREKEVVCSPRPSLCHSCVWRVCVPLCSHRVSAPLRSHMCMACCSHLCPPQTRIDTSPENVLAYFYEADSNWKTTEHQVRRARGKQEPSVNELRDSERSFSHRPPLFTLSMCGLVSALRPLVHTCVWAPFPLFTHARGRFRTAPFVG